jgi:large subunit ribosomal protein L3
VSVGILGNKIGMTQIFDELGNIVPVTIVKAGPCIITQIKTVLEDGYNAIQIGYGQIKSTSISKPKLGHLKKSAISINKSDNNFSVKYLKEYRVDNIKDFNLGQIINVNLFTSGQLINISSKTIGKGFAGVIKKHNFSRGPMSHGSKNHRSPGSIGMGTSPGRVLPGKKMPGQLGNKKVLIKKLKIVDIDINENILIIKGSVSGKPGNLVSISAIE